MSTCNPKHDLVDSVDLIFFQVVLFRFKCLTILIVSLLVYRVQPSLIQVNHEHNVVSKAGQSMHGGYFDYEGENVVDKSVESLEHKGLPRQMSHGL